MVKKAAEESTEIALNQNGVMAPDFLGMEDFGGGFEGADRDSFAVPFLQILQKMSPLVDEDSPRHIEGAKAGMIYNTVTGDLYDGKEKGVLIIPCAYKRSYILWGGRDADGGFKGEFTVEEFEALKEDATKVVIHEGKPYVPDADGNISEKKSDYYADTRSHFCLVIDEETGEFGQAILSLASTQIKASKMLMTALNQKKVRTAAGLKTPPTFANLVRLTTQGMSNEKGNWSAAKFELEGLVTDVNLFENAKAFYKDIVAGQVNVDYTKTDAAAQGADVNDKPQEAEGF